MKRSKVLLTLLCAAALVATSVFGTMAYLTDDESVTNTFTVGQVYIKLDEDDITKTDETRTEIGNAYEEILPGHTYVKDPTVTVESNSSDAYVRMMVTITYKAGADKVFTDHKTNDLFAPWLDINSDWQANGDPVTTKYTVGEGADAVDMIKRTYEFRYKEKVTKSKTATKLSALFTTLTIPGDVTNEEIAELDGMQIDVVAHAIQADGFGDAADAWNHFTI